MRKIVCAILTKQNKQYYTKVLLFGIWKKFIEKRFLLFGILKKLNLKKGKKRLFIVLYSPTNLHQTHSCSIDYKNKTYIKLYIEFIFEQLVDIPAFSKPARAFLVRLEAKPVVVFFFIIWDILQKCTKFKMWKALLKYIIIKNYLGSASRYQPP